MFTGTLVVIYQTFSLLDGTSIGLILFIHTLKM